MEGKRKSLLRWVAVVTTISVLVLLGGSIWRHAHAPLPITIPHNVSSKLLFTPYLPTKLPKGFELVSDSVTTKEGALFFGISNGDTTITFSEQTAPKNYDLNTFYDTAISSPSRLDVSKGSAVFGESMNQQGSVISYTAAADNTWIIVTSESGKLSKSTAVSLVNSLKVQE